MGTLLILFGAAQITALIVGLGLLKVLVSRFDGLSPLLLLATAWLAGTYALALERLLLAQIGLAWSLVNLALPIGLVLGVAGYRWQKQRTATPLERTTPRPLRHMSAARWFDAGVLLLIVGASALFIWIDINNPLGAWDTWAQWFPKGRALYQMGTVDPAFFAPDQGGYLPHLDYPLFVPLTIARTYSWLGDHDNIAKAVWGIFGTAALIGLYWGLEHVISRPARLISIGFLLTSPLIFTHVGGSFAGYADFPLAVSLLYGVLYLYRYCMHQGANSGEFVLSAFFFATAAFTKNEGLLDAVMGLALLIACLAFFAYRHRAKVNRSILMVAGATAALFLLPWQIEIRLLNSSSDLHPTLATFQQNLAGRIGPVISALVEYPLHVRTYNFVWPLALLEGAGALLISRRRWIYTLPAVILIGFHYILMAAAYITTPYDLEWHISSSIERLILQVTPIAVFLIAVYSDILCDWQTLGSKLAQIGSKYATKILWTPRKLGSE